MSAAIQLPPHLLDKTFGIELVASFIATALWGVQCLQGYLYYQNYPKDHWGLKFLVAWTWLMNTVHEGLIIAYMYVSLITGFGDPSGLFVVNKEVTVSVLFTVFVSVPTQGFFVWRIYILGKRNLILPIFAVVCIVAELACTVAFFALTLRPGVSVDEASHGVTRVFTVTTYVLAAAIDVGIALSMVFLLWRTRLEGVSQTQKMVARLTVYSIHTGVWTAILAIFVSVSLFVYPGTFIFLGLYLPISSLYCNTLLANLNVRHHIRSGLQEVITLSALGSQYTRPTPGFKSSNFLVDNPTQVGSSNVAVHITASTTANGESTEHLGKL